jgi:hypothetical protein
MTISHGLDWAPLLPAAKLLGSWTWPSLGVAAIVAAGVALPAPERAACPSVAEAALDSGVCLGDGSMLDPSTSLIWLNAAPGATCADIDPFVQWRAATDAEVAGIRRRDTPGGAATTELLCVNDTLARVRAAEPS